MYKFLYDSSNNPIPMAIAHRGARAHAPENTLTAAALGYDTGAPMWEFDVNRTKDGQLVIIHDDTLERTSNAPELAQFADRKPWHVCDFTLEELRRFIDAGSWYVKTDPYGRIKAGEVSPEQCAMFANTPIPTLEEALLLTKQKGWTANVEIKDMSVVPNAAGHEVITSEVLACLKKFNMLDSVILSSFQHEYLREAKKILPELATAALVEDVAPADPVALCQELKVIAYHPGNDIIPVEHIKALREAGFIINVWTVNDMEEAKFLVNVGVTGLFTDFAADCVKLLREMKA